MKISAKAEYACLAILALARPKPDDSPMRIREIAESNGIPPRFLVQILLQLKGAGLVHSTRGASGGYMLGKSPDQISIADIISVIDRNERSERVGGEKKPPPKIDNMPHTSAVQAVRAVWR